MKCLLPETPIVRDKYGVQGKDLVLTHSSELYLYGDVLYSPTMVETAAGQYLTAMSTRCHLRLPLLKQYVEAKSTESRR
jgi:hypothetical protein